jgi:hypothetical protein
MTEPITVERLRPIFRASWGADTCDPVARAEWTPERPADSQCGVTSMVAQDLLGGDLIHGEVQAGGERLWNHYWNRLPDGTEVDFTAEQIRPGQSVANGKVVVRPPDGPRRCREEYELLKERVLAALAD